MRIGEECPYITPCGYCGRLGKECDRNRKKPKTITPKRNNAILKEGENIIEDKGYSFEGKHINIFKLKDGCKIKVSAS